MLALLNKVTVNSISDKPSLYWTNSIGSVRPYLTERLLMGRKESNQANIPLSGSSLFTSDFRELRFHHNG